MIIQKYLSKKPVIPASVFLATGAIVVGDVTFGENCSVWFHAIIRGDVNTIRIGTQTNIQDGVIIHCTLDKYATTIGDGVSIGHGAIVHGCTIHNKVLIGMGAKILDQAVIGSYSIVAAGAVVREGFTVPERTLMAGVPAKPIRSVTDEEIAMIDRIPGNYIQYARDYRDMNILDSLNSPLTPAN